MWSYSQFENYYSTGKLSIYPLAGDFSNSGFDTHRYSNSENSTADWIGNNISNFIFLFSSELQPYVLLATIYFITMILTEISSTLLQQIMVPIAIAVSNQLGLEPRPRFYCCFCC